MASAKKTKSGAWTISVYIGLDQNGKKKYKRFTDTDKRRCERTAAAFVDEHRKVLDKKSFEYALNRYILSRTPVLSPATIRGYRTIEKSLKRDFEGFCAMSVYDIDKQTMQTLVNEMILDGVSPKTIANRTGLISSVLKDNEVTPPDVRLPERRKPNLHIPDTDDVMAIIKAAEGTEMEIPILLAAFGAMRRSEIMALTMKDIKGDEIHVKSALVMDTNGNHVRKQPKTPESDRYVLMPHFVIEKITERGYITDLESPNYITQRFEHIARKAGCEGTRFHDLRHWCASYLHSINIPDQYILSRGGWSTDGVMKKVYRHSLHSAKELSNVKIMADFARIYAEK